MIYVVRHGQTDLNKEGRLQGRLGLKLGMATES
jgi:probable phosphoglycerate mutase